MEITSGISATKASIEVVKLLRDMLNRPEVDRDAIRNHIGQLFEHVTNAHISLVEAQTVILELNHKLADREKLERLESDLEFVNDGSFYIRNSERDQGKDVPYCKDCWGSNRQIIPLTKLSTPGLYRCEIHKTDFETTAYAEHKRERSKLPANSRRRSQW